MGGVTHVRAVCDLPTIDSGTVERLVLGLTISAPAPETLHIPAPVAIEYDDGLFWSFEEANILLAAPTAVTPAELVDLLDGACFCASDDREADSWDTQQDRKSTRLNSSH